MNVPRPKLNGMKIIGTYVALFCRFMKLINVNLIFIRIKLVWLYVSAEFDFQDNRFKFCIEMHAFFPTFHRILKKSCRSLDKLFQRFPTRINRLNRSTNWVGTNKLISWQIDFADVLQSDCNIISRSVQIIYSQMTQINPVISSIIVNIPNFCCCFFFVNQHRNSYFFVCDTINFQSSTRKLFRMIFLWVIHFNGFDAIYPPLSPNYIAFHCNVCIPPTSVLLLWFVPFSVRGHEKLFQFTPYMDFTFFSPWNRFSFDWFVWNNWLRTRPTALLHAKMKRFVLK